MLELVNWLVEVEETASQIYAQAAELFRGDSDYSDFLTRLSKEEAGHHSAMRRAQNYLEDVDEYPAVITMDEESKWDIETPFIEFKAKLDSGKITKKELINFVILLEYSELNHLFLYSLNAIKALSGGVIDISIDIDNHKDEIETFIRKQPELGEFFNRIKGLPKTTEAKKKILIVDDTENNLTLLKDLFSNKFSVDTAHDGEDALNKVGSTHYSAIITDVDMPKMDGIEFYKKAQDIIPGLSERIVYTGEVNKDRLAFFNQNRLKYLIKPVPIKEIRAFVSKMTR